jgi:hypothetical protein
MRSRRRHRAQLASVNRLQMIALRIDEIHEWDAEDIRSKWPGLTVAQSRLLKKRIRIASYGPY